MTRITFLFPLANGLHARPASFLQEACRRFDVTAVFRNNRNRRSADIASALELVASNTLDHDPCCLEISGQQEKEAVLALNIFLRQELPHADDDTPLPAAPAQGETWLSPAFHEKGVRCFQGRALAPGMGRGRAEFLHTANSLPKRFAAAGEKVGEKELGLFEKACREVERELRAAAAGARDHNAAAILKAHLAMAVDPGFRARIAGLITRRKMPAGTEAHRRPRRPAGSRAARPRSLVDAVPVSSSPPGFPRPNCSPLIVAPCAGSFSATSALLRIAPSWPVLSPSPP
ncbi:MAG: HPr family phosphocarrier protein [Candidatus Aminicenantes bacterium]|nr:HPr family phosphocarrier protein [Candidatus Aminicenantes bacterium]